MAKKEYVLEEDQPLHTPIGRYPGGNGLCCVKARRIIKGAPFCVCSFQSYCPDHGTCHVGTHD